MKKFVLFATIALFVLGLTACKGGGKYADVKDVLEKYIAGNEKFVSALDNIKSADDVVTALNALTAVTKELAPKMKAIDQKYPEMKDMQNPPAELKPLMDRVNAVMTKMMSGMEKLMSYASDPKVQEAQKNYQEALAAIK
jgi:hypothetical protein